MAKWGLRLLFALVGAELSLRVAATLIATNAQRRAISHASKSAAPILCIGDSNTYGVGAPAGRSYPDQLAELLRQSGDPHPVLNLGFPGLPCDKIVDRLERQLDEGPVSAVVFLGSTNDNVGTERSATWTPPTEPTVGERVASLLHHSAVVRMVGTAIKVARGDLAREEFGGDSASWPDPALVPDDQRETEFERALAAPEAAPLYDWLWVVWRNEDPAEVERAWNAYRATKQGADAVTRFVLPARAYDWELALLSGRPIEPLPCDDADQLGWLPRFFVPFTAGWCDLAAGRIDQAERRFAALAPLAAENPWHKGFLALHRAWEPLLRRDFAGAAAGIEATYPLLEGLSPPIALFHSYGGGAFAALLADDTTTLADFAARHPGFTRTFWWKQGPTGHEWMVAAEWIDGLKTGVTKTVDEARWCVEHRFNGHVVTAPLRWLVDHPQATFAQVRAEISIEPPRASFIAPLRRFADTAPPEALVDLTRPAIDRLVELTRTRDLPVFALTYLDYGAVRPNALMRQIAHERGFTLVDLQQLHDRASLAADDKQKFFSADRGHPNEAGYALVAAAVRDALAAAGIVR